MSRDFKGVWIPKQLWLDKDLSMTEKVMIVEIDSFQKNGECYASNAHFAEFFNLSKKRVSNILSELQTKGYLEIEIIKEGNEIVKRVVRLRDRGISEMGIGYLGKVTGNNTSINNTKEDIYKYISPKSDSEFEKVWSLYGKKGNKKKSQQRWSKLSKKNQELAIQKIPAYVASRPDKHYRKDFESWLHNECWNDEITVPKETNSQPIREKREENFIRFDDLD